MILPNKLIKPHESLIYLSTFILPLIGGSGIKVDDLYLRVRKNYVDKLGIEKFILCLNFLFIVGKLDIDDEIVKAKL